MPLIAIEGIDGSGKTAIARHLRAFLFRLGYDCVVLKEPSNSVYGKILRLNNLRFNVNEELRLFLLDRKIHVKEKILPALRAGKVVIMDRYYYSNIAYQSVRGIDARKIREMNEKIAPKPDLVILLDISADTAMQRLKARKQLTKFEEKEYLAKVRRRFLEIADERCVILNAEKDLKEVKKDVEKVVMRFLELKNLFNYLV